MERGLRRVLRRSTSTLLVMCLTCVPISSPLSTLLPAYFTLLSRTPGPLGDVEGSSVISPCRPNTLEHTSVFSSPEVVQR
ncbi:hypothetical protein GGS23DRAFT_99815 [Durotheca rogersii]|uniref:uncharacterized protein n=1 Tax=Durotheca rogersii TaxID=419775 RepID=UPI00221FF50E|nr:uncharacterized protein GGS23DRAFT_99815 [Durotheca rogersii]KAI5862423.1 hypothetical protein GGS23DRAFT_99815 [Durotheca rogersii]